MRPFYSRLLQGLAAAALVACSKKAEVAAAPQPGSASPPAPAAAPLKVAFVYGGPIGEAGWNFAHDQARRAVEQEFGSRVSATVVDRVPESADAARVLDDLCEQGNQLIFATSFGFMGPVLEVAARHAGVKFEHATGFKTSTNVRTYNSRMYEVTYLAGIVAGAMTKTGKIGVVGAFPIPEVIRNLDAFSLGAQSQNPSVQTRVVWVNEWFNPPREAEAAQTLLHQGADVLLPSTDSGAVLQAAESAGKFAFGIFSDKSKFAPHAHLASAVVNWAPYYRKAVREALEGSWQTGDTWWGVGQDMNDLVNLAPVVPAAVRARVEQVKAGLKDGSFVIWKGPIADASGKQRLAAGQVADEPFILQIDFQVHGVVSSLP